MKPEIQLLKEIIKVIDTVFKDSAYIQSIVYAANENGKDNWYRKAKKLISDNENNIA